MAYRSVFRSLTARADCKKARRSSCRGCPNTSLYAPKAARRQVSEILRMLKDDGWSLTATRGSHRQFKHASKPGRVTVPGKPSDDLAPGTLNSILKQSGLKK